MFIYKMILLTSTASIMTMSSNATLLSISTTEQVYVSSYYTSMIKRLLILFGSISILWFIMGLIFASIQTFRHLKKRTNLKLFRYNRSLPHPSSILPGGQSAKEESISDDDDDDDQASVFTSVSFLSERSRTTHEHTHFVPPCDRIPEEEFELQLPSSTGIANMAYSQSTLSSSAGGGPSLLYYPACRNFAYSQSTLASSNVDLNTPTPSVIIPVNDASLSKRPSTNLVNLKRHSSQSSTNTTFSQITNATYLSSSSTSTSSSIPTTTSIKSMPLPTVMITDCDRLQTDIIELDSFEPEKDWRRARPELRLLLNDRRPQAVR